MNNQIKLNLNIMVIIKYIVRNTNMLIANNLGVIKSLKINMLSIMIIVIKIMLIIISMLSCCLTNYSYSLSSSSNNFFMFCGVNQGYQGNLVTITDPQQAMNIVNNKLLALNSKFHYEIYPGLVTYRKDYGCPDGGEVIAVITSSTTKPDLFINIGKYLKKELLQSTLSIVMYTDNTKVAIKNAKLSRGFQAIITGYAIKQLAHEWQYQAARHMTATMYVTAGFYTKNDDNVVFIQGEANPEKPHLNSAEKIKELETMAILVSSATAKKLNINNITIVFKDVYFTYLNN